MSSFDGPAGLFLFDMVNGKKKLLYGRTAEEALETASLRLEPHEMEAIRKDRFVRIQQRDLQRYVRELG